MMLLRTLARSPAARSTSAMRAALRPVAARAYSEHAPSKTAPAQATSLRPFSEVGTDGEIIDPDKQGASTTMTYAFALSLDQNAFFSSSFSFLLTFRLSWEQYFLDKPMYMRVWDVKEERDKQRLQDIEDG